MRGRGRKRKAPAAKQPAKKATQGRQTRSQARLGLGDEVQQDPILEDDPGKRQAPNVIDFEQILRESGIAKTRTSSTGTGRRVGDNANNEHGTEPTGRTNSCSVATDHVTNVVGRVNSSVNVAMNHLLDLQSPELMRVSSDNLAAHLPSSLKQQIGNGDYVNLALLLKGALELRELSSGGVLKISPDGHLETGTRSCKDKITSIERWTDAFLIYSSVYLASHPTKIHELLQYIWLIRECTGRQGGSAWREYDEQFRIRKTLDPTASWSETNSDLWWRCVQTQPASSTVQSARPHMTYQTKLTPNVCFDNGLCKWHNCRFAHVCTECGRRHAANDCFLRSSVQENLGAPTNRPFRGGGQSNFRGRGQRLSRGFRKSNF